MTTQSKFGIVFMAFSFSQLYISQILQCISASYQIHLPHTIITSSRLIPAIYFLINSITNRPTFHPLVSRHSAYTETTPVLPLLRAFIYIENEWPDNFRLFKKLWREDLVNVIQQKSVEKIQQQKIFRCLHKKRNHFLFYRMQCFFIEPHHPYSHTLTPNGRQT